MTIDRRCQVSIRQNESKVKKRWNRNVHSWHSTLVIRLSTFNTYRFAKLHPSRLAVNDVGSLLFWRTYLYLTLDTMAQWCQTRIMRLRATKTLSKVRRANDTIRDGHECHLDFRRWTDGRLGILVRATCYVQRASTRWRIAWSWKSSNVKCEWFRWWRNDHYVEFWRPSLRVPSMRVLIVWSLIVDCVPIPARFIINHHIHQGNT